jgi:uncharacterized protein YaiE (UPF0345 family)
MTRKISVILGLAAAGYISEVAAVDRATTKADGSVHALGRAADEASRDLGQTAVQAAIAKRQIDDLGDEARGTAAQLKLLKASQTSEALTAIEAKANLAKTAIHDLGVEFARTGDAKVGQDLDSQRSILTKLNRLRGELEKEGEEAGKSFLDGIGSTLSGVGGRQVLIGGLVGLAVAASPAIGAIIGGAVVGGVGLGGIAGGVIAAAHDQRVKAAWQDFAQTLTKESFGSDAFTGPVIESIGVLKTGLENLHLDTVLGKAAVAVVPLSKGLSEFASGVMPGVNAALNKADQYGQIFETGLGDLGDSIGDLIRDFAESEGSMDGLRAAFSITSEAIRLLGAGLAGLGDVFHDLTNVTVPLADALADVYSWMPGIGDAFALAAQQAHEYQGTGEVLEKTISGMASAQTLATAAGSTLSSALHVVAQQTQTYSEAAYKAAMATGAMSTAWDILHGKTQSADEALLSARQAVDAVKSAFEEGTRSVAGNSDAVLENRVALERAASQAAAAAQAYYELHVTTDGVATATAGANAIMEQQRTAAEKAAGATGKQAAAVHDLAVKLFNIPPYVPVNIGVTTTFKTIGSAPKYAGGVYLMSTAYAAAEVGHRAAGGPVGPGVYEVGERGPEILTLGAGTSGYVHPSADAWKASQSGGDWKASSMSGGAGTMRLALTISPAPGSDARLMAAITDGLRFDVATQSGGSVDVHLARGRR